MDHVVAEVNNEDFAGGVNTPPLTKGGLRENHFAPFGNPPKFAPAPRARGIRVQRSGRETEAILAKTLVKLKLAQHVKHPRTDRDVLRSKSDFVLPS